ncbi:phage protein [Desulfofarcimen acetoxidans DSM 771]|uniref:Phage protein n=1 Tax=Desulfofarcimen acetoxidans (strain ATCC 49208 / DSM 771 / KCTC 5769 / VKM B-1644 / 5575) TaxID=485916 RepID=C8VWP9_DESAS|nr:hypothetical protein [Desulfofarcimen acetoxidans]ACV64413.1 phage protein [Desulfofarcimen acetoxidans DSM 771]
MKGHGEKLTRKMELAVAALLTAPTIGLAAQKVGISEITLWRWLQTEEFKGRYAEAKRQAVGQAIARLQQSTVKAVDALEEIVSDVDAKDTARVAAAKIILETALRGIEIEDLAARVELLEKLAKDKDMVM